MGNFCNCNKETEVDPHEIQAKKRIKVSLALPFEEEKLSSPQINRKRKHLKIKIKPMELIDLEPDTP